MVNTFIAINNYQLLNKYDDSGRELNTNLMAMGKITEVFRIKATSNGFSVFTNFENYLIDANLTPYFNQIRYYVYYTGISMSSITHRNYNTDLLLCNDSFIVSVANEYAYGIGTNGGYSETKFYKSKISTDLPQPILLDSGSIYFNYPFLYIKVLNVLPVYVGWQCNKNNMIDLKHITDIYSPIDITACYLAYSLIKPDTVELCARNYFKSQFSVDVCKSFIFKQDAQTGIDNKIKESIQIYPNPASDFVEINTGRLKNVSIELYNLLGQEIPWQEVLQPGSGVRRLYFTKQTKGIYTIKINTDEGAVTQKILIAE